MDKKSYQDGFFNILIEIMQMIEMVFVQPVYNCFEVKRFKVDQFIH